MKAINTLGVLALLALIIGCGNTADGVKQDADVAADRAAEAAAATGSAVGGAMQTGEVKTALLADTRIDASDINVDTNEDAKTVTLKGTVRTESEKLLAGEIATTKAAGYTIVNDLTVKP